MELNWMPERFYCTNIKTISCLLKCVSIRIRDFFMPTSCPEYYHIMIIYYLFISFIILCGVLWSTHAYSPTQTCHSSTNHRGLCTQACARYLASRQKQQQSLSLSSTILAFPFVPLSKTNQVWADQTRFEDLLCSVPFFGSIQVQANVRCINT